MGYIDNILSLILLLQLCLVYNFACRENKMFTELGNKVCRATCLGGIIMLIIEQYLIFKGYQ